MDLVEAMAVFVRVADTGSFSAAARERGVTQPTVSKQIAELERRIGTTLLHRNTRALSLTEPGERYLERCRAILADIESALTDVADSPEAITGTLRVNAPVAFGRRCIIPHLHPFMRDHPRLQVELTMNDRIVDLVEEGVDVAIRVGQTDPNLVARSLGASPRVVVASPSYLTRHGRPRNVEDLANHNCLVYVYLVRADEWDIDTAQGPCRVRVRGSLRTNNTDALHAAVVDGVGVGWLPLWMVADDLRTGRLAIAVETVPTERSLIGVSAVYSRSRRTPEKVRRFVDYLRERMVLPMAP